MASQSIGKLFDDITQTESGAPATYRERLSTFNFLTHAGGEQWTQARELLESWCSDYPDESKDRLRNDFRSENEGQHVGAWWELYTFTLYRRLGYCVTVEPPLPDSKKKIDFLVTRDNASMYVECAVDGAEDGPFTGNPAIEAWIYDCINKVQNRNFLVGLEFEEEETEPPAKTRSPLPWTSRLDSHDPDRVIEDIESAQARGELAVLPEKRFCFRGWVVSCIAFPNAPDKRYARGRLLGSRPSRPTWPNNV